MTEDNDYGPFRRDRDTSARIKRFLTADYVPARDRKIVVAVEQQGINFANIDQGLDAKRRIISEQCGYDHLQISQGRFLPLSECSSHRINTALRREYQAAKKRQSKSEE